MTSETHIDVTATLDFTLRMTMEEVWPDGDAPDEVTASAVIAQMQKRCRSIPSLDDDWNLGIIDQIGLSVDVTVPNPYYTQAESLLPDEAAKPHTRTTEWWS